MKLLVLFMSLAAGINGLKILAVLPVASKSHWVIGHEIVMSLVNAGHEATVLTPFPLKNPIKNYEEIPIPEIKQLFDFEDKVDPFWINKLPKVIGIPMIQKRGLDMVELVMEIENVKKFMKRQEKFDICFLEAFHIHSLIGIFDHFNCSFIPYTSSSVPQWIDRFTANQSPTSYVGLPFLPYSGKLTFTERFWNTLYVQLESFVYNFFSLPMHNRYYKHYFPDAKKPFYEMVKSAAFAFMSTHGSVSGARPYLPNMIEIGGIHIKPAKPLPEDIKKFLDSAIDGAVLFSMGSIVKARRFPEDLRESFVRAFGKIKQKVLWKYENDTLPNKPDNVMISPWIPQRDILAHPNVKLFISHGGYLGTTEAVSEGVPILGMALYGDQARNLADAIVQNRGLKLDVQNISEEIILNSINEILNNPKYKKNAEAVAKRFKDRVMTPQQQVVYWTEYVARHNGAKFLRSAGADLNAFEFYSIDVYAVMLAIFFVILYFDYKIIKFVLSKLKKKVTGKVKKN